MVDKKGGMHYLQAFRAVVPAARERPDVLLIRMCSAAFASKIKYSLTYLHKSKMSK